MAIRIGYDPVQTVGRLAKKAGEVEASQIEAQRAEERFARAQQMQFSREMAEFEANLQMESRKMAMQQVTQEAILSRQHDFALREWEKEFDYKKLKLDQVKKDEEFTIARQQIIDSDQLNPEDKKDALLRLDMKRRGLDPDEVLGRAPSVLEKMQADIELTEGGYGQRFGTLPTQETPGSTLAQPIPEGQKLGISNEARTLEQQGKLKVISPEGVEGTIDLAEWKEYKDKGFELYYTSMATGGQRYQEWKKEYEKVRSTVNAPIYKKGPLKYLKAKQKQIDMTKQEPLAWNRYMEEIRANLQKGNQ